MKILPHVPSSVRELAAVLSQPKPMRRGSVSERTMKCGKAGCPCQEDPNARHVPYYSLTRPMSPKTHSRYPFVRPADLGGLAKVAGARFYGGVEGLQEERERSHRDALADIKRKEGL